MRELTIEEYEQVSGGIAPLLGAAAVIPPKITRLEFNRSLQH